MKVTKNILIAALAMSALLTCSSSLRAQDSTNTPPAGMKSARQNILKELNLTDDQKPKFHEIMKGSMEKRKALRDDTNLTPEDKKAKMKAIQEDTNTQLKALLTVDQFAKWQEMTQKAHHKAPPADAPPQN
jgi:protein CpxP